MAKKKKYGKRRSNMIDADYSKPSNLPTEVMMKMYPKNDYYKCDVMDDLEYVDGMSNSAVRSLQANKRKTRYF